MNERNTIRLVQLFFGVIGCAAAIVFVQYFFEFSFAVLETIPASMTAAIPAVVVAAGFTFAWAAPIVWRLEWVLSLFLAVSGLSAVFFFFSAAAFGGLTGLLTMLVVAVGLITASLAPWFTLRCVAKGRAGRSDGQGHIDFLDGGHGRTELRAEGDVVAWLERTRDTTGYREDGDATRYRAVVGTREDLVAASRRRSAFLVLAGLSAVSCFIALQSMTYFRWAYYYPGLQ